MASITSNTDLSNILCASIMSILDLPEDSRYQAYFEDVRELRFTLRQVVYSLVQLSTSESSNKEEYEEAIIAAGGQDGVENAETVAYRAVSATCEVLDSAGWGFVDGREDKDQPTNTALQGTFQGLKRSIAALSETLKGDGTAEDEYSDEESKPVVRRRSSTESAASASPSPEAPKSGRKGNFSKFRGAHWADRESLELLRVERDRRDLLQAGRVDEFNLRVANLYAGLGLPREHGRTQNGYRLQFDKLKKSGVTVESLEAGLAAVEEEGGDGVEDGEAAEGEREA